MTLNTDLEHAAGELGLSSLELKERLAYRNRFELVRGILLTLCQKVNVPVPTSVKPMRMTLATTRLLLMSV